MICYQFCSAHHKVLVRILPFENKRANNKLMAQKVEISLKWTLVNDLIPWSGSYRSIMWAHEFHLSLLQRTMYRLYCCSHKTNSMQTSPPKVAEENPLSLSRGAVSNLCHWNYNWHSSGSLPSPPTKQKDSRLGKEPSQSHTKTLHYSDTSQHRAWELDSAVQCKNTALPTRKKNSSPFLLTGFSKTLHSRPHFFPSPRVGIVTHVMIHHNCLVFSCLGSRMRQKHMQPWWGKVTCQHNAVVFPTPFILQNTYWMKTSFALHTYQHQYSRLSIWEKPPNVEN